MSNNLVQVVRGQKPKGHNPATTFTLLEAITFVNIFGVSIPMEKEMREKYNENLAILNEETHKIDDFAKSKIVPVPDDYKIDMEEFRDVWGLRNGDTMDKIQKVHEEMTEQDEDGEDYKRNTEYLKYLENYIFTPVKDNNGQDIPKSWDYNRNDKNAVAAHELLNLKHKVYLDDIKKANSELKDYLECEIKVDFKKATKDILPSIYPPMIFVDNKYIDTEQIINHPVIVKIFHYSIKEPFMKGTKGGKLVGLNGQEL